MCWENTKKWWKEVNRAALVLTIASSVICLVIYPIIPPETLHYFFPANSSDVSCNPNFPPPDVVPCQKDLRGFLDEYASLITALGVFVIVIFDIIAEEHKARKRFLYEAAIFMISLVLISSIFFKAKTLFFSSPGVLVFTIALVILWVYLVYTFFDRHICPKPEQ